MKNTNRLHRWLRTLAGAFVLMAVLAAGFTMDAFTITSHAESMGKITATSAKIRKEPSTSSETVGSAEKDATVSVKGQTTGGDGYTWYQVSVDANTTGYIRSDLMEITDGSTPATIVPSTTGQSSTASTPTTSTPDEALVDVEEVEPVSASVSGTSPVRVRQNASTTSRIVSTAQGGLALTVTGKATGTDGKNWYLVNFIANGSEVSGFIRADYVSVSGDLVPAGTAKEEPQETEPSQEAPEEKVEETKDWETYYQNDEWHLLDNTTGNSYNIAQIFETVEANNKTLKETLATNQTQQIVVIALVILAVLLASVISFLIFKLKDLRDAVEYEAAEREAVRRRTADRPVERKQNGQRPAQSGQRPAQSSQRPAQNGQRPAQSSQRPAQSGQRPAQSGQRPAQSSQRPAQGGQRPAQSSQRPAQGGQRPVQNGQRPAGQHPIEQRVAEPVTEEENRRPLQEIVPENVREQAAEQASGYTAQETQGEAAKPQEKGKWKSRNFADDDEFEFQFLDWDEE